MSMSTICKIKILNHGAGIKLLVFELLEIRASSQSSSERDLDKYMQQKKTRLAPV